VAWAEGPGAPWSRGVGPPREQRNGLPEESVGNFGKLLLDSFSTALPGARSCHASDSRQGEKPSRQQLR